MNQKIIYKLKLTQMKKLWNLAILIALLPLFVATSCTKDDDDDPQPQENKFEVLKDYLVANNMDLDDLLTGWVITASDINAKAADDYYFIDLRSKADFDAGHINGAVNSTLGEVLDKAANADKPIIVVCYTGQTAGHAVAALRLSGYTDAKVMKWGMSGWRADLSASWENNKGNAAVGNANWVATPGEIASSINFNKYPTITSTHEDGANILNERVAALLEGGFTSVTNADVLADPSAYCINNYWTEADVTDHGNITGAYRIQPLTLSGDEIKYLNPDQTVVTYCWTGQTSSMITAYLKVLGYDAKSLFFGANGMIYDNLQKQKWSVPTTDYPVVQTK